MFYGLIFHHPEEQKIIYHSLTATMEQTYTFQTPNTATTTPSIATMSAEMDPTMTAILLTPSPLPLESVLFLSVVLLPVTKV